MAGKASIWASGVGQGLALSFTLSLTLTAAEPPTKTPAQNIASATAKEKPAVARQLVQDEIKQIGKQREGLPTQEKPIDLSTLAEDKDFAKVIAAVGGDPKKTTLNQIKEAADKLEKENDEQGLYLLAAALKLAAKQEAGPDMTVGQIAQSMLLDSLQNFGDRRDSTIHLPEALQLKLLAELQSQDQKQGLAPRKHLTGSALQKYFEDSARAIALTNEEKIKIAGASNLSAARDLSDFYLPRSARAGANQIERANPGVHVAPKPSGGGAAAPNAKPSVFTAPGQHRNSAQREQPDFGGGGSIAGGALPSVLDASGGRANLNLDPGQASALSAQPVEFDESEGRALTKAVQKRKSLTMEIGRLFHSQFSKLSSFAGESLCQATVVHPADLPPFQKLGDSCRYVLASAKHCFSELQLQDVISLAGFNQPIDAAHRKVIVSAGQGEDFATMLVDVPCDSVAKDLPSDVLAPAGMLRPGGGQAVVLDVQRTGDRAVAGRTAPTRDSAFVGVNVLGQGRIFPGDSGGRLAVLDADGQTYFAGVTSSKYVDAAFQDAVGNVAIVPNWLREGFASGEYLQPLPTETLAKHLAPPDNALLAGNLTHR